MNRPRISFLVPDISAPSVGAALKLADLLRDAFDTEIVGPDFGGGICGLYRGAYPFRAVPAGRLYRLPDYLWERRRLGRALTGDLIVAVKAFADTVPVALQERRRRGVPVAVYLDEWDGSLWHQKSLAQRAGTWLRHAHHPLDEAYHGCVERMIPRADTVLSTTTFLQRRFGGHVAHAGVDCDFFQPQPAGPVAALKRELGLDGRRVIVFGGVVRPHKGAEDILEALAALGDPRNALLVVGPVTDHLADLQAQPRLRPFITVAGAPLDAGSTLNAEIHKRMNLYLDVGDLVVLPLRDTPLAQSQMPIKVFEALAMGKPVVATRVADLPALIEGAGWVVPAGDQAALTAAIGHALDAPEERTRLGQAARRRAVREFSRPVCAAHVQSILGALLAGRRA